MGEGGGGGGEVLGEGGPLIFLSIKPETGRSEVLRSFEHDPRAQSQVHH